MTAQPADALEWLDHLSTRVARKARALRNDLDLLTTHLQSRRRALVRQCVSSGRRRVPTLRLRIGIVMTLDALDEVDPIVQDARVWLRCLQGHGEQDRAWLSNFNTYVRRSAARRGSG